MSKKKSVELVPALRYLRKSTKGIRKPQKGKKPYVRQEKSISQQREETDKLADGKFSIVGEFIDDGVSGWKRGMSRPAFDAMLKQAKQLGAQAIVVDNLDRFSRAACDEVREDADTLRKSGVRWIVTASHGTYDLGARYDIGEILRFTVSVWSNCEYSRQLGRRVALARRNRAMEGLRSGGAACFGLELDDEGGLKHHKTNGKIAVWIFEQFGNELRSLSWIASDLNRRKIPATRGGKWSVKSLSAMIKNPCYRGDFQYGASPQGKFFRLDGNGEVVETSEIDGKGKVFVKKGRYAPLIPVKLWDKCNRRLESMKKDQGERRRGYALSGLIICDHCNEKMYPAHSGDVVIYRCSSNPMYGAGSCGNWRVKEEEILPFILRMLSEEVKDIQTLLSNPPEELTAPRKHEKEKREQSQKQRDALAKQIDRNEKHVMDIEDERTRKSIETRLTELRDELERLDSELSEETPSEQFTKQQMDALVSWWQEFEKSAVSLPLPNGHNSLESLLNKDPENPDAVLCDARKVNEALRQLGAEIRLRFSSEEYTSKTGRTWHRHKLEKGRFRLGARKEVYSGRIGHAIC